MTLQEFKDSIGADPNFLAWVKDEKIISHTGNLEERLLLYLKKISDDVPPRAEMAHIQFFFLSGKVYLR